ncbi:extracellular solute-binding protein [Cohnella sp. GCM10012308]|uniref:extracellular solute-binding protein n=1 Tax=Cohnella sp. GCM10012308 TaxID=3317329 RepID=UPI00361B2932
MKRSTMRKITVAVAATALTGTLLAGCGNDDDNAASSTGAASGKPSTASASPDASPTTIKIMSQTVTDPIKDDNPMKLELEKMTNTKLEFTWVPATAYNDKFNATLASGELPQVMLTNTARVTNVVNAVRAGAFWEIGPYLDQFPNLSELNKEMLSFTSYDGKIYLLPRSRDGARHLIAYRKDWANNLGLAEPKTLEDLANLAKAFTDNDPDKNGKNDTIGYAESSSLDALSRDISVYLGGPMNNGMMNDQVVPNFLTPAFFEGMKWYRELYAAKAINQDFALLNGAQQADLFKKGKAGIIIAVDSNVKNYPKDLQLVDSKSEVGVIQGLSGPEGLRASSTGGSLGGFLFSKSSIKTEEELLLILGFFDKLSSPEAMTIAYRGMKDVDYKMEDGFVVPNEVQSDEAKAGIAAFSELAVAHVKVGVPLKVTPFTELVSGMVAANEKIAVYDVAGPLISNTKNEKGPELDKMKTDAIVKFIMGQIDEAGYQKAIEDWKKAGGDQVIVELTEEYKKAQGK